MPSQIVMYDDFIDNKNHLQFLIREWGIANKGFFRIITDYISHDPEERSLEHTELISQGVPPGEIFVHGIKIYRGDISYGLTNLLWEKYKWRVTAVNWAGELDIVEFGLQT